MRSIVGRVKESAMGITFRWQLKAKTHREKAWLNGNLNAGVSYFSPFFLTLRDSMGQPFLWKTLFGLVEVAWKIGMFSTCKFRWHEISWDLTQWDIKCPQMAGGPDGSSGLLDLSRHSQMEFGKPTPKMGVYSGLYTDQICGMVKRWYTGYGHHPYPSHNTNPWNDYSNPHENGLMTIPICGDHGTYGFKEVLMIDG